MASEEHFTIVDGHPSLYNADLAPLKPSARKWGAFEIFNVWSNDIQSLFGYTLAATLFVSSGLNGWWVFAGIILAGLIVMGLVNLTGKPSVKYGIPYPVMARAAMGIKGANFPALVRGIVAIFWYGVQTYFASTAVAMLLYAIFGGKDGGTFLGLTAMDWIAYIFVSAFQVALFLRGIDWITKFLNWAGPLVYLVMIALALYIWFMAGNALFTALGSIFSPADGESGGLTAFLGVVGTMIAYFAAVIINYGDFSRFVKTERAMKLGNLLGLPVSLAVFSFLAMWITAGTMAIFGETLTNPSDMVAKVDNVFLTLIAAATFFGATVGINLVANFIPPSYDLANLAPSKISARTGGFITAGIAFFIGALWLVLISKMGIAIFVDTLGAVLAPLYGILVADYYLVHKSRLNLQALFTTPPSGEYYYQNGWNKRAMIAFAIGAVFSVATVYVPFLHALSGFAWIFGALLGGAAHVYLMRDRMAAIAAEAPGPAE
ncbi:NCS1 family nucleobase:cation symporter-1 [Thioclava sp. BHET1]|uniref:Allantoin permease n=1 Tax=Thioclava dalianensis TaxID=1185766 RepID=A0A074U0Q7_9RHOB|nr:NCS1 family nucleobase:cation symporter-1 [Thioclava dalianensis]KEP68232.1 allantoin permease [Thioclava dalianensis]TMV94678.1 NCS1 family nucleobase:cation symporter-1 [Thioclava sp. BHET1]SFM92249.1 nucleobase:cation symporter-1, NCS1 family [Thioclava dalianensis]